MIRNMSTDITELTRRIEAIKQTDSVGIKSDEQSLFGESLDLSHRSKIFRSQPSDLTHMLQLDDVKSIYNVFVSAFMFCGLSVLITELFENESLFTIDLIKESFSDAPHTVFLWFALFGSCLLILPIMKLYVSGFFGPKRLFVCYLCVQLLMAIFGGPAVMYYNLPAASSLIILCEHVRLAMKMHSFVCEMKSMLIKGVWVLEAPSVNSKSSNTEENLEYFTLVRNYIYFLYCPTLVYRHSYPRSSRIRWDYIFRMLLEFIGCVIFTYIIFSRLSPMLQSFNPSVLVNVQAVMSASLSGIAVFFLIFYMLFHCWLNAWAEFLRFADRSFYGDWWNSDSISPFQKKIATFLQDWIFTYIYSEFSRFIVSSLLCNLLSILLVLGIVEYIAFFAFRIYYPLLSIITLCGAGYWLLIGDKVRFSQLSNTIMWIALFLTTGSLLVLYANELNVRRLNLITGLKSEWYELPYSVQLMMK